MRTVLLNISSESDSGQLWEVMSSNEEALSEWEHRTSSSYRPDIDQESWELQERIRRKRSEHQHTEPSTSAAEPHWCDSQFALLRLLHLLSGPHQVLVGIGDAPCKPFPNS